MDTMEGEAGGDAGAQLAILFADISGSSLLYAVRGDVVAFNLTSSCLNLMDEHVQRAGGRVVKRLGDAILAAFESAAAAVRAATTIQEALAAPDCALRGEGIHVRAGISYGPAVLDAGDVYGDIVNVASRLVSHAGSDEIILSGPTYDQLPAELRADTRPLDQVVLRGRPSWELVYQYLWKQEEDVTLAVGVRTCAPACTLEVTYGSLRLVINSEHPKIKIGRASDNDIAVEQKIVSHYHAEIALRGDKFFLVDSSTNGTYVQTDNGEVLRVSREGVVLAGSGRIALGAQSAQPITYRVSTSVGP